MTADPVTDLPGRTCICLIPALFDREWLSHQEVVMPYLDQLARKGDVVNTRGLSIEGLLGQYFLADSDDAFPAAACLLAGLGEQPGKATWARLIPVHFRPDRDRLLVFPLDDESVSQATLANPQHLVELFNQHFADAGCHFHYHDGYWFVQFDTPIRATTSSLAVAASEGVDKAMPAGDDAALLRRIMTELQMLLHQQMQPGQPQQLLNGFWLEGLGSASTLHQPTDMPLLAGETLLLKGISRLVKVPHSRLTEELTPAPGLVMLNHDETTATGMLALTDRWIGNLLKRGRQHGIDTIVIADESGHGVRYSLTMKFRWWRRGSWRRMLSGLDEQSDASSVF